MKTKLTLIVICNLLSAICFSTYAQGTAFTYQGRLNDGGAPAHGTYDFRFKLFEDAFGNNQAGGTVLTNGVSLTNGLFMMTMDFGAGIFNGSNYWLEVDVRTNGAGGYADLNPLQAVMPTPYAIFANTASNLSGTLSAAQLSGAVSSANLSGIYGSAVTLNNAGNNFSGNGSGLTSLNASQLAGGTVPSAALDNAWKISGNNGTTAGANFVGTSDNQPLELRVSSQRVLRLELNSPDGPNIIGGYSNNFVGAGISSATIAGGGLSGFTNRITGSGYGGSIGGGRNNVVSNFNGVVSGGANNTAAENATSIAGGSENFAGGDHDAIGGGQNNTNYGDHATIGGGANNLIVGEADHATIGGGGGNVITGSDALPVYDTIGGGQNNIIESNATYAFIGGGYFNIIQTNPPYFAVKYGAIGGGYGNTNRGTFSTIGGGELNFIFGDDATIGGGNGNSVNYLSTVGGGANNTANGFGAFVGGGGIWVSNNFLINVGNTAYGNSSAVGGGAFNYAAGGYSTIGGGFQNTAGIPQYGSGNSPVVGGGYQNTASADFSVVSGGSNNVTSGFASTVPGGISNTASGSYSLAAGKNATASQSGAFVWADGLNFVFDPEAQSGPQGVNNSFNVRSTGGFYIVTGVNGSGAITAGAQLAASATSWSTLSDRNAKKNFAAINYETVLAKLAQVPVEQWNYKWEKDSDTPNLGPMAQDFKAAFYPGRDDKSITTLEFDGVELAAIQGLNEKVEVGGQKSENRIQKLEAENSELKQKNESFEKRLEVLEKFIRNPQPK